MNILVTGGSGYIGRPVVHALQDAGHNIRVFDRVPYESESTAIDVRVGDLLDPLDVKSALENIDAIVHLAAFVRSGKVDDDTAKTLWEVNHKATEILVAAAKEAGVGRFVLASTCSLYPPTDPDSPADESTATAPTTVYAETKQAAERVVLEAASDRFHPTILRFATVYGDAPRISYEPLLNAFVKDAVVEGKMVVFAPQSWRPFIHVDDAARAVVRTLAAEETRISGEIFNVGDEEQNLSKGDAARLVAAHQPGTELVLDEERGDPRSYCVRFDKIRDVLGFRATLQLDEGVRTIVARTRKDHIHAATKNI